MPNAATKVAIIRSVPSAGNLIAGTVIDLSSAKLSDLIGEGSDLAREPSPLPGKWRLALVLNDQSRLRQTRGVRLGDTARVPRIGRVVAGDDQRRQLQRVELRHRLEWPRARHFSQRLHQSLRVLVLQDPLTGETQNRVATGRLGTLVMIDVVDEAVHAVARERRRQAIPISQGLGRSRLAHIRRSDDDEPAEALWVPQRVGNGGVRAHRVAAEHKAPIPDRCRDHGLEVADQLRVSITLPPGRGIRLAVTARVIGDDRVAGPLQRPRAVDDVAPRCSDPVAEDNRWPLPHDLAAYPRLPAGDERPRLCRHQAGFRVATACSRSSTVWKLLPVRETCL